MKLSCPLSDLTMRRLSGFARWNITWLNGRVWLGQCGLNKLISYAHWILCRQRRRGNTSFIGTMVCVNIHEFRFPIRYNVRHEVAPSWKYKGHAAAFSLTRRYLIFGIERLSHFERRQRDTREKGNILFEEWKTLEAFLRLLFAAKWEISETFSMVFIS